MKRIIQSILIISLIGILTQCNDDEITSRNYPRLNTLSVTEITSEGAKFNAEIIYRGGSEIINYGFVWGKYNNPTKENSDRIVYTENIQSNKFSMLIETTLKENTTYFVRSFVETSDFTVYGENVDFISLGSKGPQLTDFLPKKGHLGDTIKIKGINFGRIKSNVEIKINQNIAEIIDFEETEILALIPNSLSIEQSTISVSVSGNISTFNENFTLLIPNIENLIPTDVTFGSTLEIEGSDFNPEPNKISISFIGASGSIFPAEIISVSENRLVTKVPFNINSKENYISLEMNNFRIVSEQKITIKDPSIISFTPQIGKTLTEITIFGENFSSIISNNIVRVDGYPAEIINADNNELIIKIPDQSNHIYSERNVKITVEVFSSIAISDEGFNITNKWFRIEDLPFEEYVWKGMTINNEGYVIFNRGLWNFNPINREWVELTPFPDFSRSNPGIFSVENKIYLGAGSNSNSLGNNDFWEYNISSDNWEQKENFPGAPRSRPLSFSIGSDGYMGVGLGYPTWSCCSSGYADVWKYNVLTETWSQIEDYPEIGPLGIWNIVSTELNNQIYLGLGSLGTQGEINNKMYKLNSLDNQWIEIDDFPIHAQYGHLKGVAFTIGDEVYFGSGEFTDSLWSFNGSWTSQESHPAGRNGGFSFVIDNIGYFGGGEIGRQFWLFDKSQPD